MLVSCPKATPTVLLDDPVMGSLLLGLLKWLVVPESRKAAFSSWEVWQRSRCLVCLQMCLWRHVSDLHVGGDIIVRSCRIWGGDVLVEVCR